MVDSEPTVTRRALHGAINGTICPCCPNAILACAAVPRALRSSVVESESGGARDTLRSAVHRTIQSTLRHSILAFAGIQNALRAIVT